jgi:hypothetical protein
MMLLHTHPTKQRTEAYLALVYLNALVMLLLTLASVKW